MLLLAVETSCDETAAAVLRDGREVVSSIVASQVALHAPHGGVVPELAARSHLEAISPTVAAALAPLEGGLEEIDALGVTRGPGLVGCLIVGTSFAQALAAARRLPIVGVSHIAGHLWSAWLDAADFEQPFVALVASGGHTECCRVAADGGVELLSATRDDAAGEAFDKVARLLGLGYPGGPAIERAAASGDPERFRLPVTRLERGFSFSGLKTAVRYALAARGGADSPAVVADMAAAFQRSAVRQLVDGLEAAVEETGAERVAVVGGVAANTALRAACRERLGGLRVAIPPLALCTDNAAMIGAAAWQRLRRSGPDPLGFRVEPGLRSHD